MVGYPCPVLQLCSLRLLLVTLPDKQGLGCKGTLAAQPVSPGLPGTSRATKMDTQPSTMGRLGQRATGHRSHLHPSIPVLGTPSPPSPIAVASARKGHGAGTSSRRLPITDEPCLAWQAHYHHGFIAQHLLAQLALSSLSSPISLSASILNPRALPRRNCRCSVTLLTASAALVRIRLCIRK